MNNIQRTLLAIYLSMSIVFLMLDNMFPGKVFVNYIKFTTVATLFATSTFINKSCLEQRLVNIALFFVVIGDFFINVGGTISELKDVSTLFGLGGFTFAYIMLILAFQKNFKVGHNEVLAIFPVLIVFILNFLDLAVFLGSLFYPALVFGLVLSYMSWTCICTIFRGHFNAKISRCIAIAGFLLLLSDVCVAHALFNPEFSNRFVPWLENIIWITYIPSWVLIVLTVAEDKPLVKSILVLRV